MTAFALWSAANPGPAVALAYLAACVLFSGGFLCGALAGRSAPERRRYRQGASS